MKFFSLEQSHNRVFGLDLLRFVAILMVLVGHSLILVPNDLKPYFHKFLLDGVAIFFVLSGFLIGGILIRQLEKQQPTFKGLLNFWTRRWMRTVPAYLFVLLLLLTYTWTVLPKDIPADWWRFFLFIQNFEHVPPSFFAESWSLSIEEWFYLTIPVILFGTLAVFKFRLKPVIIVVSLILTAFVVWYRYYIWHKFSFGTSHPEKLSAFGSYIDHRVTYSVVPRLDGIMIGVVGAYIAHYFPRIWNNRYTIFTFAIGCWLLYYTKRNIGPKFGEASVVWFPLIKSGVVLMMLPVLANWKNTWKPLAKTITFFSLISYSMYLVNLNVVINMIIKNLIHGNLHGVPRDQLTEKQMSLMDMDKYYVGKHVVTEYWWLDYLMFWVLVIAISFLLYKFVETPFMKLRDRNKVSKEVVKQES